MAYIEYVNPELITDTDLVLDEDNILRIHGVNSPVITQHFELYKQLMHNPGPLTRVQREMIGIVVSAINECHY